MYRAELVGTRAAIALGEIGRPRPYVVRRSTRAGSAPRRTAGQLRLFTPRIDRLIAVSRLDRREAQHEGRDTAPISLIHNGVDLERYDHQEPCCTLREEYGLPSRGPDRGGRRPARAREGPPDAARGLDVRRRRRPDATLLVVGEGSRRGALEAMARELGIADRVVFTGRRDDVPAVTAALDVAVLPSYREALGLTILEAMALSRPIVASNVGGIPEMVEDGVTGLLVPPHDAEALAAAIVRLLHDHPLADTLGRAGHDLVHERFCIERMVPAVEQIYEEGARTLRLSEVAAG